VDLVSLVSPASLVRPVNAVSQAGPLGAPTPNPQ